MFDNLSERLEQSFKILKGQGRITEINIADALKDVRRALLDADVSYKIAKDFTDNVKDKALGANVTKSVQPKQQIIKIVHDELTELMGVEHTDMGILGDSDRAARRRRAPRGQPRRPTTGSGPDAGAARATGYACRPAVRRSGGSQSVVHVPDPSSIEVRHVGQVSPPLEPAAFEQRDARLIVLEQDREHRPDPERGAALDQAANE